jgi:hypothetical protein
VQKALDRRQLGYSRVASTSAAQTDRRRNLPRVYDTQVLDFLYGSVLVFFVIKIEKIGSQGGDVSDSCTAIGVAATPLLHPFEPPHSNLSPGLLKGTTSQFALWSLSSDKPLDPSGILTPNVAVQALPDCPIIASFLAKIPSFLPGSGSRIEIVVTYRKQRNAYESTRRQNSPLATIKSTHIFTSNKVTNRASCESSMGQNPPMGPPKLPKLGRESHHV